MVDQDAYVESVADVAIPAGRLYQNGPLQKQEVAACRTALGALQWLAIQTQPQLCARCNLLLTEVVTNGTLETAREIQQMITEVRAEPFCLEFRNFLGPSNGMMLFSFRWVTNLTPIDLKEIQLVVW